MAATDNKPTETIEDIMARYPDMDSLALYDFKNCPTRTDPNGPYFLQDVVAALLFTDFHLQKAATLLGRRRNRLREYLLADEDLSEFYGNHREGQIDSAESLVVRQMDGANARFLLATRGKNRGYSTRVESTGPEGGPIGFQVTDGSARSALFEGLVKAGITPATAGNTSESET